MFCRDDEHQFIGQEGLGLEVAPQGWSFDQSDIDFLRQQVIDDFLGIAADHGEANPRELLMEAAQQFWEHVLSNRGGGADVKFAGVFPGSLGNLLFGPGNDFGNRHGVPVEDSAGRGQRNLVAGAVKQTDGEFVLQGLDMQGDGGLGKAKLLGRPVKAEQFGNRAEYL